MSNNLLDRLLKSYQISRPILFVLLLAALIIYINSYPNVPGVAEDTNDYRLLVKSRLESNQTVQDSMHITQPGSPSLPNTITPVVSPEEVDNLVNPKPKSEPPSGSNQSGQGNDTDQSIQDDSLEQSEPALEIKLLAGILNVAPLILVATLGGFGIYLLFKYKKHFTLRTMFGTAIALVAVCTLLFFCIMAVNFVEFINNEDYDLNTLAWVILPVSIMIGGLISYNIISIRTTVFRRNIGLGLAGAMMGSFMATFLPIWLIFILLIAISLFDMYSVKFGPIKKIMDLDANANLDADDQATEKPVEKRIIYRKKSSVEPKKDADVPQSKTNDKPQTSQKDTKKEKEKEKKEEDFDLMLMYDNPDWSLGLGDFVIYSMFTSVVLTYSMLYLPYYIFYSPLLGFVLPWLIFLFCVLGVIAGFTITLKLLQKHEYLPGLPMSIGCGLLVFMMCIIVLQVVNYLLYAEFAIII